MDFIHNLSTILVQKNQNFNKWEFGGSSCEWGNGSFGSNNSGQGRNQSNIDITVIYQICFIPEHRAHKCKNWFNPAFILQRNFWRGNFRPGFGQYGRGYMQ